MDPNRQQLERFAREHHVHYDVQPDTAIKHAEPELVGFSVRLFAMKDGDDLAVPGGPGSTGLISELQRFTQRLISSAGAEPWTDIVPEHAALHESTTMRGADEVALTVRVWRDENEPRRTATDDHRLSMICARLESLGVPRTS